MASTFVSDGGATPRTDQAFNVEIYDGHAPDEAGWPSLDGDPRLTMQVYQSREFVDVWMRTIGRSSGARGFLVVVRDRAGAPFLFLPLAIERRLNIRVLRFMDAGVADINAPILAADRPISAVEFCLIWKEILLRLPAFDVIDLQKMPAYVGGARNPLTLFDCQPYRSGSHVIDMSRGPATPGGPSHHRMRKRLDRFNERLALLGPTDYLANPAGAAGKAVVSRLFALKKAQYLRTFGYNFFDMPGIRDFYTELTMPDNLGRFSHLSALTCGETVVSAHLGFRSRGRFYYILPAFDTRYRALSPGHLLLDRLIHDRADAGDHTFDLGEGDYSYKAKWETDRIPLFGHRQAVTAAGSVYLQLARVRRHVIPDIVRSFGFGRLAKAAHGEDALA
jgi:CelD/BcsL family acetyltransferase involved in cellulose biosynthesis